jgi:hypothetical protein
MKKSLLAAAANLALVAVADAGSAPSMSTRSLRDNRSRAECLDYSAKVMRALEIEHIRTTQLSVHGQSAEINFVIRCDRSKNSLFAAAGGDDGDRVESLVQTLMPQFEITKDLPKCSRNSSPLHLCQ